MHKHTIRTHFFIAILLPLFPACEPSYQQNDQQPQMAQPGQQVQPQ